LVKEEKKKLLKGVTAHLLAFELKPCFEKKKKALRGNPKVK